MLADKMKGENMKISKEEKARREGMAYALKIAKEKGVDGLEEEIRFRNVSLAPIVIPRKELTEFTDKVKANTIDTVIALSSYVLRDKFDFGAIRINRFIDWFNKFADSISGEWLTFGDIQKVLREEVGIELQIRKNDKDVKINER